MLFSVIHQLPISRFRPGVVYGANPGVPRRLHCGKPLPLQYQLPTVVLVCNFGLPEPPGGDGAGNRSEERSWKASNLVLRGERGGQAEGVMASGVLGW